MLVVGCCCFLCVVRCLLVVDCCLLNVVRSLLLFVVVCGCSSSFLVVDCWFKFVDCCVDCLLCVVVFCSLCVVCWMLAVVC